MSKSNKNISVILAFIVLAIMAILVIYPLFSLLGKAFVSEGRFSLQNFHKVFITKMFLLP